MKDGRLLRWYCRELEFHLKGGRNEEEEADG